MSSKNAPSDQRRRTLREKLFGSQSITERTFILTDGCMWEMNKKQGTFHPHAIEVVDMETGQVRYIKSGAKIKFVEGDISDGRNQATYNNAQKG